MDITKTTRRSMFDPVKHRTAMVGILKDLYGDPQIRTLLGFKGGTAAMLFYNLPRMSVDLDFNLLDEQKKHIVLGRLKAILPKHGALREATEKRFTLFSLVSYQKGEHTIKIEISKRPVVAGYHMQLYLGISVLIMKEPDMAAGKLAALVSRRVFAMRDVFDIWFFLKEHWTINEAVFRAQTGSSLWQGINLAIKKIQEIPKQEILKGLGELLDEKQKILAKDHLIEDAIFQLRLYRESLKGN